MRAATTDARPRVRRLRLDRETQQATAFARQGPQRSYLAGFNRSFAARLLRLIAQTAHDLTGADFSAFTLRQPSHRSSHRSSHH